MLLPEEQRVMGLKYKSKRVRDLTPDELLLHTKGLCFKVCIITGWQLPEMQEYVNVFEDQLRKFLVDEYMNLNMDEFEYAMRVFGTQVIDWGKSLNLSLIRQSLDSYLSKRAELSKMEEQGRESTKRPEKEAVPAIHTEADWSDTIQKIKSGDYSGTYLELIPWSAIYDWMDKRGEINLTPKEKWIITAEVREKEMDRLRIKKENFLATPDEKADLERIKCIDWHEDKKAIGLLMAPSKKFIVNKILELSNHGTSERVEKDV